MTKSANQKNGQAVSEKQSNMYAGAKTWSPFKGCGFDCTYCVPSFQRQAKRQLHNCQKCYGYTPHCHPDRLLKIPSADIIFVAGNSDISFCPLEFTHRIIERIRQQNARCPDRTYYFQSKRPEYFAPLVEAFPSNVILLATLETNRDEGYGDISKAPPPSERYRQFKALKYPRKVVTIEPVMDFDPRVFAGWMRRLRPEFVWLGLNSKPKSVKVPEPAPEKLQTFTELLVDAGIEVRGKDLRGIKLPVRSK